MFMALIGGAYTFAGPLFGSLIYTLLHAWVTGVTQYWSLVIGLVMVFIVFLAPTGVVGLVSRPWRSRDASALAEPKTGAVVAPGRGDMGGALLVVRDLWRSFGGLAVTQGVSLDLVAGSKEAIIGPNGAGKSTFFNLLTGYHTGRLRAALCSTVPR